jgi:regulator of sirC expression with transglutaminase-like and TPR domain
VRATVAIDVVGASADAHATRGLARAATGDRAGARRDLERALELAPEGPLAPDLRKRLAELPAD